MNSFKEIVSLVYTLLCSEHGLAGRSGDGGARTGSDLGTTDQISMSQLPVHLVSQHGSARYPRVQVYCERIENQLREKFNTFSGVVHLVIDVYVSQERWDMLAGEMEEVVAAITRMIETNRGELQAGAYMPGRYTVDLETPKAGGRGYVQAARIKVPVEVVRA